MQFLPCKADGRKRPGMIGQPCTGTPLLKKVFPIKRPIYDVEMALSKYFLNTVDLLILLIFEVIFFGLVLWAIEIGDTARSYAVIAVMIISLCPLLVEKLLKITLPFGVKSIIALSLFLHVAGGVMRWYWSPTFPLFDKVAHFVSGLSVGLIILVFFLLLDMWGVRYRKTTILIAIFLLMAFFGGMWKVVEISNDVLNHTIYNDGLSDIIGDNVAHTIGSLAAVVVAYLYFLSVPKGENIHYLIRKQVRPKKTGPDSL